MRILITILFSILAVLNIFMILQGDIFNSLDLLSLIAITGCIIAIIRTWK